MADPNPVRTKLDKALAACQGLHKDLKNRRNRGEATDLEVELVARAIDQLRRFARGRGLAAFDLDSRAAKDDRRPRQP